MAKKKGKKDRRQRSRKRYDAKATAQHSARIKLRPRERPNVEPAPELEASQNWYVVMTSPKLRLRVVKPDQTEERRPPTLDEQIRDMGFVPYRPSFKEEIIRRGKKVEITRQLFPNYLLVGFRPTDEWQRLLHMDGITAMLRSRTTYQPIAIPRSMVEGLARKAEESFPEPTEYAVGQGVRITDGPFASFPAFVTEAAKGEFIGVEVNIFGRATPVDIPLQAVEAL